MSFIPPHARRLARRIQAAGEPLVQVWGWPGSGRAAVLEALLESLRAEDGAPVAAGLSLADLTGARGMREAIEEARAGGVRWLVASACPEERVLEAARWLRPGQRLVFTTEIRYRLPAVLSCAVVPPQELLLTDQEVACLWLQATGGEPDPAAARRLREASDGWYRPLALALEATGGAGLAESAAEALLEVRAVRSFLRHEVLEPLDEKERELLLEVPPEEWLEGPDELRRLVAARGLWVEGPEGEHPPRLLAAYLARQQRSRRPAAARTGRPVPPAEPAGGGPPLYVLGLLGEPVARQREPGGGERELDWRLRRSFQVLAFLASSPNLQAGREELIEAIWPREGERTIDRNFHPTLSHLRRSLEAGRRGEVPPPLLFRGGVYRLNPEIVWEIDLLCFKGLIEEGRTLAGKNEPERAAEAWKRAWGLYRGPFLLGYYEAWVNTRRETYQRHYLDLLCELGDLYMKLGRLPDAMDAYRSVLVEDPLRERIHLAVMRIYSSQGRRDLVRRQYDRLCTLLLEELGVEPMPQTTREYHELMA